MAYISSVGAMTVLQANDPLEEMVALYARYLVVCPSVPAMMEHVAVFPYFAGK